MAVVYYKWLMTGILALLHPFFVGVTEVQHNAKDKTLEVSVKLFAEDLEKTLSKANKITVDLNAPKDSAKASKMVAEWTQKGVTFAVCNNTMNVRKITKEDLLPQAVVIPAAVIELALKQEAGWSYFRGGK